ncbi:hypothetical protein BK701_18330 [Bacillus thuringiensis serovar amagiensis]|nr:hypothetical protein YBT1520_17365 [Bacillus thuringiensis serovar kurstaki str. YBT-1520]AIE34525.1 hypothetical protein BTK_17355 [Bacillus thuringiensis serovar kurstaki str. HD-1]EXY04770.1 hypothetical protein BF15_06975 [Bacillus thuringiensis]OTW58213.1 hypothetical protein BK701_18330 [Bacillus thuringiensis serovar amagiensis]OTY66640.1 hypothetical protein BK747_13060 [Bacillus thuringiensis serovar azorensis]OTZ42718.1 hypothetical protein BK760_10220 [Bacillus thuringiensis sero
MGMDGKKSPLEFFEQKLMSFKETNFCSLGVLKPLKLMVTWCYSCKDSRRTTIKKIGNSLYRGIA